MINPMYVFTIDVDDYQLLAINDLLRMFIIQLIPQILFSLRHDTVEFLSVIFIENTLFILLGLLVYWLVFNNIILFTNKKVDEQGISTPFYQNIYSQAIKNNI
jgi:hypothetical protein